MLVVFEAVAAEKAPVANATTEGIWKRIFVNERKILQQQKLSNRTKRFIVFYMNLLSRQSHKPEGQGREQTRK